MVSKKLKIALKLGSEPAYRVAQQAGLDPTLLSKLIHGVVKVEYGDQRIIAVGQVLDEGYRTYDIASEGTTKVGTKKMGDLIAGKVGG